MLSRKRSFALGLIATGLFGAAVYTIAARSASTILGGDTVHGVWIGACIGLEIVGVVLLLKARSGRAA